MEITEVRIKLMDDPGERLKAFCSITFDDCFVVRDLKIIEGSSGPFVAMPSRKLTSHCQRCGGKNHLRASYCNQCGAKLDDGRAERDDEGRAKLYADIAHPINSTCREMIQEQVIDAYEDELETAKQPGYVSRYDDYDDDLDVPEDEPAPRREASAAKPAQQPAQQSAQQPAPQTTTGKNSSNAPHGGGQPRGPHKKPESKPATPSQRRPDKNEGFGAGIF